MMFTREDFELGKCCAAEYYDQFVTEQVIETLQTTIGHKRVVNSTDPHFNDIPDKEWDALPVLKRPYSWGVWTPMDLIEQRCAYKEAARQLRERFK
jgi:hypothetical protein